MGTIARGAKLGGGTNFNSGQKIASGEANTDFNTVYTEINGLLDDGNIETATIPGAKSLRFTEISAPANPSGNDLLLYGVDNAARTRLAYRDSGGLVNILGGMTLDTLSAAEATRAGGGAGDIKVITLVNSCPVGDGLLLLYSFRKTSGAAVGPTLGLKANSTQVFLDSNAMFSAANQAESGFGVIFLGTQVTNYLRAGMAFYVNNSITSPVARSVDADFPNATITTLTITGDSQTAGVTLGVAEAVVYRMSRT